MTLDLETILTSPKAFGLETASPLQRAICRMIDGRPLGALANREDVCRAFGGAEAVAALPVGVLPKRVTILAGIRTGKTLLAAAVAVRSSQNINLDHIRESDRVRTLVIAPKKDLAGAGFQHISISIQKSPWLKKLLVGKPLADSLMLRCPSGRAMEVKVVAASAGGESLVSGWLGDVIEDEACRTPGADDNAAVTLEDMRTAGMGRLLGQWLEIGSPWIKGGPVYKDFVEHFGKPSAELVVVKAPAYDMNPSYWTPAKCEALRVSDPRAYETDVLANFIDDTAMAFDGPMVDHMFRGLPQELIPLGGPVIITDSSGGGGDSWVWCSAQWFASRLSNQPQVLADGYDGHGNLVHRGAYAVRDKNGVALRNPDYDKRKNILLVNNVGAMTGKFAERGPGVITEIVRAITSLGYRLGTTTIVGDQYSALSNAEHFRLRGMNLVSRSWTGSNKVAAVARARSLMRDGEIIISASEHAPKIKHELGRYRETIRQSGVSGFAGAGTAHDDYVSCCIMGVAYADMLGHLAGSPARLASTCTEYGPEDFNQG